MGATASHDVVTRVLAILTTTSQMLSSATRQRLWPAVLVPVVPMAASTALIRGSTDTGKESGRRTTFWFDSTVDIQSWLFGVGKTNAQYASHRRRNLTHINYPEVSSTRNLPSHCEKGRAHFWIRRQVSMGALDWRFIGHQGAGRR